MNGELYVAVYFDSEEDFGIAHDVLRDPVKSASFLEGWLTRDEVDSLRGRGLAVVAVDVPDVAPPAAASRPSKRHDPWLREVVERMNEVKEKPALRGRFAGVLRRILGMGERDVHRLRLRRSMGQEMRELLKKRGIDVLSFRDGQYQVELDEAQREWLAQQDFVESVRRYDLLDTVHTALVAALRAPVLEGVAVPQLFDLTLHTPRHARRALALVQRVAGQDAVVETSDAAIRFRAHLDEKTLATLADLPWVQTIMPVAPARLSCDVVRPLIGLPPPPPPAQFRWNGEGEIVGVIDSGIDRTHPDVKDQLAAEPVSFEGAPVDDRAGHGTHIAGIIAGSGAAARAGGGAPICGIAPGAKLVVVANVDAAGVPNVPLDVEALFDLAVSRGASILNVSWGRGPTKSAYDATAKSIDRYVRKHPGVLVVVAAGNYGTAPEGDFDFYTLSTPATAKNALSVGASATSRDTFAETLGQRNAASFPIPAARDERLSGNASRVAGISSRGPTEYESAKPELVAPGTHILAPRAKRIDPQLLWSDHTTPDYVYFGGTSMATPVVAGAAAIVRQYLRAERGIAAPSAALLKAVLIGGASQLPEHRSEELASGIGHPDFDQGFGRLDLAALLPAEENGALRHRFAFDDVADDGPDALAAGAARSYSLFLDTPGPLVVTLVWTDLPDKQAQNSLTLSVKRVPGGKALIGNAAFLHMRPKLPGASPLDRRNTVHQVRIDAAEAGEYVLRVTAHTLLDPRQGYALVAHGDVRNASLRRLKS